MNLIAIYLFSTVNNLDGSSMIFTDPATVQVLCVHVTDINSILENDSEVKNLLATDYSKKLPEGVKEMMKLLTKSISDVSKV